MDSISYIQKKKNDIRNVVIVYPFTYINPYYALPPIAAEYLQAGVIASGRNAVILDMRYETDIRLKLKEADMVCLYGFFEDCSIFGKWHVHCIPDVLALIPDSIPVIAGGTGFKDYDKIFRMYEKIDVIIRGNPEIPIMELLKEGSPEKVKNLAFRKGSEIVYTERIIHDLPENIYPKRNLRNPSYKYHVMGIKVDLIRAAVGCNYRCNFCFEYGKDFDGKFLRWQGRSAESLKNELMEIDAPIVGWVDDDMTTDMKMLEKLSDLLIQNKIKKLYMGTGRIDHVLKSNVETLKKMETAGFAALSFGVESLKRETLKLYGKGQTPESIEKAMAMMQKTNILLVCNFILGSPGETEKDMMDMLWFGRRWNADTIVTNRFRLQDETPLKKLMYDQETGKEKPGMARIEGDELLRIKRAIKFGQRTPLRIVLSLLKLYRHKGMFIDPAYLVCSVLETVTKHTWLEKTKVFPALLRAAKRFFLLPFVRSVFRTAAIIATPPIAIINRLFEFIDKHLGITAVIMPWIFSYLDRKVLKKQKALAQARLDLKL